MAIEANLDLLRVPMGLMQLDIVLPSQHLEARRKPTPKGQTMRIIAVLAGAFLSATICVTDRALAAGVVGTGTPASCTEAVLDAALTGGGTVTFNCGPSPVTIPVTHQTTIKKKTSIDGGGLITLGGSTAGVFEVRGKTTLSNLAFSDNIASAALPSLVRRAAVPFGTSAR